MRRIAAIVLLAACTDAGRDPVSPSLASIQGQRTFFAVVTGANATPQTASGACGKTFLELYDNRGTLSIYWRTRILNPGGETFVSGHIADANGDVVLPLFSGSNSDLNLDHTGSAAISSALALQLQTTPQSFHVAYNSTTRDGTIGDELAAASPPQTMPICVASVTVDPPTAAVDIGGTQQFTATVMGSDGNVLTDRAVTWASSDDAIATVDANGLATAHAAGSVTISATADGVIGSAALAVAAPPTPSVADLAMGAVSFSSSTVVLRCTIGLSAVIQNTGQGDAGATHVRFSLRDASGATFATATVVQPALASGASTTVNASFIADPTWPSQITGVAESDAANAVPEANEGNNDGSAAVTLQARLSPPPGFDKMWVCGTNTSWTQANNWEPVGAPSAADNVYIPAGAALYPVLTNHASVEDLTIEDAANVDLSTFNLTSSGNVVSGQMLGTGLFKLTGAAKTVRGNVAALDVLGTIGLSGLTTATSTHIAANHSLDLKGFTLVVSGGMHVSANGGTFKHLLMTLPTDRLEVGGTMHVQGMNQLDDGIVVLRGNFAQSFRGDALAPTGTKFVFDGTAPQNVSFSSPASSYFGDVEFRTPASAGVHFSTSVRVAGQLTMTLGAKLTQTSGATTYYTTRLPDPGAGSYEVPSSTVDGAVMLDRDLTIPWPSADFRINANRTLDLKGFTLVLGGGLHVAANGGTFRHLLMTTGTDRLEVGGTMHVQGMNQLDVGTVVLRGDFNQSFRGDALTPTGTKFVFDGTTPQSVSFSSPASSYFGDVEFRTPASAGVNFATSVRVAGQLTMTPGAKVTQTNGTTSFTTRLPDPGAGSYEVPNSVVDGTVTMNRNLTIPWPSANVRVNANRSLDLKGFALVLGGGLHVAANGGTFKHLLMTTGPDALDVGGDMHVQGMNLLDAGTVVLRGDFMQSFRGDGLTPTATKFVFDGAAPQSVTFSSPASSYFGDVEVRTPASAGVNFATSVRIAGQLTMTPGAKLTQTSGTTLYTTRLPDPGAGNYEVPNSVVDGTVTMNRDLTIPWPSANLRINANRSLNLSGFSLVLAGGLHVAANGGTFKHLVMTSSTGRLDVGGLMHVQGMNQLDAGTIVLRGSITQSFRGDALAPAGTKFVFDGSAPQTVTISSPSSSFFQAVDIRTGASVSLATTARMKGDLDLDGSLSVPAARVLTINGTMFFAGALTNNGVVNAAACVNQGGTFSGTGNNPCP